MLSVPLLPFVRNRITIFSAKIKGNFDTIFKIIFRVSCMTQTHFRSEFDRSIFTNVGGRVRERISENVDTCFKNVFGSWAPKMDISGEK